MTDWSLGGWSGSLNAWVRREVKRHLKANPAARGARRSQLSRYSHWVLSGRRFWQFLVAYLLLNSAVVFAEFAISLWAPDLIPAWTNSDAPRTDIKSVLSALAASLITAQVGVLGVVSIAIGLVTLIAQRDRSSTDVRIYYHEALAFEVVASSIALLLVLCVQFIWPFQFALHLVGAGTGSQFFKLVLAAIHVVWLIVNLSMMANFVATTFDFVQQSSRKKLRERYEANVLLPISMTQRLRSALYRSAGNSLVDFPAEADSTRPRIHFAFDFGAPETKEISSTFSKSMKLFDVRMLLVKWAARSWAQRCIKAQPVSSSSRVLGREAPLLSFTLNIDERVSGSVSWCRRRGGVPLNWFERIALRKAFRFARFRE